MNLMLSQQHEELRLKDLWYQNILDTPEEKDFNDLIELAAQICNCPYAMISFIDKDRQWFKATKNIMEKETSRDISFCAQAVLDEDLLVVDDARQDERFKDYENVTGGLKIVFYAGAPVISSSGYALGTVCVIDEKLKRVFTNEQRQALKIIARQVSKLLELKEKNRLIAERGDLLIASEKRLTQLIVSNHEKEKVIIAAELHENIAQTLAGIKLYLEVASKSKVINFDCLQKGKERVTFLIKELQALTKAIVPTTLENDDYVAIINHLILQFGKTNNISVKLAWSKDFGRFSPHTGLTIFRIFENQLKIALIAGAKTIKIKIKKEDEITILFTDDGHRKNVSLPEKDLLFNSTLIRIGILNGRLDTRKSSRGKNTLSFKIPMRNANNLDTCNHLELSTNTG